MPLFDLTRRMWRVRGNLFNADHVGNDIRSQIGNDIRNQIRNDIH